MNSNINEFISLIRAAADGKILKKAVISKLADKGIKKVVLSPKLHKGAGVFVLELYMADGKVTQKNSEAFPSDALLSYMDSAGQANVIFEGGECEYKASKNGNSAIIGKGRLTSALGSSKKAEIQPMEKEKNYILTGNEPFLFELGISEKNGRIKDKKQAKFRQICRFLEYVRDILPSIPEDKVVIYDLCCGKSYLSFAVYHYFKSILGREVNMLCVDLKADVMEFCSQTAKKLGYTGMHFEAADITKLSSDTPPDLVLSLHACDTATDLVLENAVRLGAKVILSTPCCHRDLSRKIDCAPLSFATEHSILKSKLCDALTDSLRVLYLEKNGYKTDASELVDPEDTPKNVIIRGVKKRTFDPQGKEALKKADEYKAARSFLGLE